MKVFIDEDKIDGYETVCVSKQDTGLPYDLLIDSLGKDRGKAPEVKVVVGDKLIKVGLCGDVSILNGTFPHCMEVQEYIKAYLHVFLAHYNKLITDRQALMLLTRLEEADSKIMPFEMARLPQKRTGIPGNIFVYDTDKRLPKSRHYIIYENAGVTAKVYFTDDIPEGKPELQKVIEWVKLNREILIKLYSGIEDYDSMDFINEMKPVIN